MGTHMHANVGFSRRFLERFSMAEKSRDGGVFDRNAEQEAVVKSLNLIFI